MVDSKYTSDGVEPTELNAECFWIDKDEDIS